MKISLMKKNKTDDFIYHYTLESVDLQTANEKHKENIPIHLSSNFLKLSQSKINSLKNELEQSYYLPNRKQVENNMHLYEFEKDTWDILSKLYMYRDVEKEKYRQESTILPMQPSQTEVYNYLMKKNFEIRENSIILQWLEEMSSNIELNLDPVYWDHTFQELKNRRGAQQQQKSSLVTELDPDASSRQNVAIDKEDEKNQAKFLQTLWAFLRAGNKEGAVEFCVTVGQYWRAQTLLGFNYYDNETNVGNPYFNLWKSNCLDLSNKSSDIYEKAVYGVMSGNLNSILQVSKNWYDYLWSYLRILFDERIYQELKPYRSSLAIEEDIEQITPSSNLSQIHTPKDIINLLKTSGPQDIKNQSKNPYHLIQQMIINDDYRSLFDTCAQLISKTNQPIEFTRFVVMLILFFRKRECYQQQQQEDNNTMDTTDENSSENIIINEYVKHLINTQQHELVALYTSLFSNENLRITVYSKFLETITDQATRQQCLGLAEQFGLNTQEIAQSVVKNITGLAAAAAAAASSESQNNKNIISSATTQEDYTKIDSIKWLCFDKQLLIKAILSSNLLIREFIKSNKYNASSDLLKSLPKDIVAIAKQSSPLEDQDTNNIIKEFKDWENYLAANNRMNIWLQNYSNQPKENLASFKLTGKESYAQKLDTDRRKKDYDESFGQWNQNNIIYGQDAISAIHSVLNTGWLCPMENPQGDFDNDDENGMEINDIRKRCIPSLFKSLHTVLIGTDQISKSSRICNKIADERFQWFNVFTKAELQEILYLVRESSIKILNA